MDRRDSDVPIRRVSHSEAEHKGIPVYRPASGAAPEITWGTRKAGWLNGEAVDSDGILYRDIGLRETSARNCLR
jgi:hypothetical protein